MRRSLTIPALAFALTLGAGAAWADDDCFVPMANWQPRDAVIRLAQENGWTVRRIRIDDGCYQIIGRDAQGRALRVTLQPDTLEIRKRKNDKNDKNDKNEEHHND